MRLAPMRARRSSPAAAAAAGATVAALVLLAAAAPCEAARQARGRAAVAPAAARRSTSAAFGGASWAWRRRLGGLVPTPHRVSRLAAWVDPASARAGVSFSPGVDGDWARPAARAHFAAATAASVAAPPAVARAAGRDLAAPAAPHGRPEANITLRAAVDAPLLVGRAAAASAPVLLGFNLTAECVDAHQPANESCNSNGAWLTELDFSLACDEGGKCEATAKLARAEDPDMIIHPLHKPKPFNYALDWSLEVLVGAIAAPALAVTPPRRVAESHGAQLLTNEVPWHSEVLNATAGGDDAAFDDAVLSVSGFGFTLHRPPTGEAAELPAGRYLEELAFECRRRGEQAAYDPVRRELRAECRAGVRAARESLVWPALVDAWVDAALIEYAGGAASEAVAAGEVCVSGDPGVGTALFSCEREGLVERVDDVVQLPPPVSE